MRHQSGGSPTLLTTRAPLYAGRSMRRVPGPVPPQGTAHTVNTAQQRGGLPAGWRRPWCRRQRTEVQHFERGQGRQHVGECIQVEVAHPQHLQARVGGQRSAAQHKEAARRDSGLRRGTSDWRESRPQTPD